MAKRMSEGDVQAHLGELLKSLHDTQEPVIVEKNGAPYAVLISPEQYERALDWAWATVQEAADRNSDTGEDEIAAIVTAEVEAVRQEQFERKRRETDRRRASGPLLLVARPASGVRARSESDGRG